MDTKPSNPPTHPPSSSSSSSHLPLHIHIPLEQVDSSQGPHEGRKSDDSNEPPITPGGSLSPAVHELIQSFRQLPFRTHRRSGSGGSGQAPFSYRRTTSMGLRPNSKQSTPERGPWKSSNSSTPTPAMSRCSSAGNTQYRGQGGSAETLPVLGAGAICVPYSKLNSTDSDSDRETQEPDNTNLSISTPDPLLSLPRAGTILSSPSKRVSNSTNENTQYPVSLSSMADQKRITLIVSSNESSCDVPGTDGHDADSESNNGEMEGAVETHLPSRSKNFLSLSPPTSPFSLSPLPRSSTTSTSDPTNHSPLSSITGSVHEWTLSDNAHTSSPSSSINSQHGQVAHLISQFEGSETSTPDANEYDESVLTAPQLEIPLHIRRDRQFSGSYSPVRTEQAFHANGILNSTSIVRHYFENVSRGGTDFSLYRTYSKTELEDSGFQVRKSMCMYNKRLILCPLRDQ